MADKAEGDPTTPERWRFIPEQLDRTVLAIPLLNALDKEDAEHRALHAVVMEINLEHVKPRAQARKLAEQIVAGAMHDEQEGLKDIHSPQYLYARLWGDTLRAIVDENERQDRPIYRIWPDFEIGPL